MIGEAARGVSQSLKDRHPEVLWPQIVALRNILVHEYFGLNMRQVWTMTQEDLPKLEEQFQRIRSQTAPDSVEYEDRRYTVLEMERNRIARVRIGKLPERPAPAG